LTVIFCFTGIPPAAEQTMESLSAAGMGTNSFNCYIVNITVASLKMIVTNEHLQLSTCNKETETFQK
jgi:hypothetical protein